MTENAIAALYAGPLEDFVRRRDALARELRAAGDRDAAADVKALRKPSRVAWALDLGVHNDRNAFEALDGAVAATLDAQTAGGNVRAAMAALREAVRTLANVAADASERSGQRIETGTVANAILAVLGTPERFEQLRSGRLAEVPEAGGLDFLARLPAPARAAPVSAPVQEPTSARTLGRARGPASERDDSAGAAAREHAKRAAETLNAARASAEAADQILRDAESELLTAEERVRQAENDLATARERRDGARRDAEAATAELGAAETANAEAERAVSRAPVPERRPDSR